MATEERLIKASTLLKAIEPDKVTWRFGVPNTLDTMVDFLRLIINEQPAVDAVEVVHGHWCWEGKFKACSRCGSYVEWDETLGANFWKFCPYCGAKMDGGNQ